MLFSIFYCVVKGGTVKSQEGKEEKIGYKINGKISPILSVEIDTVAFCVARGEALMAIDLPQYSNNGMSVEPSPTATHSSGEIPALEQ